MHEYCRSPVTQGVFENVVRREGLEDEVEVDSAGTGNWHTRQPPDSRAMESVQLRGLDISHLGARQVTPEDCWTFDYVPTMDEDNYRAVSALCTGNAVVRPFLDLAEEASESLIEDIRVRHLNPGG